VSAIDFTVSSAVALRTALDLARTSGGRVTMVHALKNAPGRMVFSGSEAFGAIDEVHAEAADVAARLRREIPPSAASQVDSRVTTGDPHLGILDVASQVQADLIVMGVPPHGRVDEATVWFNASRSAAASDEPCTGDSSCGRCVRMGHRCEALAGRG
jgi:nucleotide-binding universal stress UspA family protein